MLLAFSGTILFAYLPILFNGYTYPPGDDPVRLEYQFKLFPSGYYGHWPAKFLGMTLYYYLTPVLSFLGLYAFLSRYGVYTVLLAWAALWLLCRTLLFDLHAGTFVGVINFYFLGLILLRLVALWHERKIAWPWPIFLAAIVVPFHAFTGGLWWIGATTHTVLFRRSETAYVASILGIGLIFSWKVLHSSIAQVQNIPTVATTTAPVVASEIYVPAMSFQRFMLEYVGAPLLLFWFLALMAGMYAWSNGWRPKPDTALIMLGHLILPLGIMSFTPLALNADRTVKLLVAIITLLATVVIVLGLRRLNNRPLNWISAGFMVFCFGWSMSQTIPYWLSSGSYR